MRANFSLRNKSNPYILAIGPFGAPKLSINLVNE